MGYYVIRLCDHDYIFVFQFDKNGTTVFNSLTNEKDYNYLLQFGITIYLNKKKKQNQIIKRISWRTNELKNKKARDS